MKSLVICVRVMAVLLGCGLNLAAQPDTNAPPARNVESVLIQPPLFSRRPETNYSEAPGDRLVLDDGQKEFTLYLPPAWKPSEEIVLTVHFRGLPRLVIDQHLHHNLKNPLIVADWGPGTPTYQTPFSSNPERFAKWITLVLQKLREKGASATAKITQLDLSSFSGGYGSIREIIKNPEHQKLVRRVVLCDSMFASYEKPSKKLLAEHIDVWLPIIRAAMKGEKTFVLTYSQVDTAGYASTKECAVTLGETVGVPIAKVELDACPAANDDDFPLIFQGDSGAFHLWGYGGTDGEGTMTHLKHLGDTWGLLDSLGDP